MKYDDLKYGDIVSWTEDSGRVQYASIRGHKPEKDGDWKASLLCGGDHSLDIYIHDEMELTYFSDAIDAILKI